MADEKMIEVPEGKLNELLTRLNNLERGITTVRPKRITQHTAYMRTYDGGLVVDFDQVKTLIDPVTKEQLLKWDIKVWKAESEKKEPFTVDYLNFLNEHNSVKVLVKEQKAKTDTVIAGYINTTPTDPVNTKNWSQQEVPLEVTTVSYDVTVEVLEGDFKGVIVTVPNKVFNI